MLLQLSESLLQHYSSLIRCFLVFGEQYIGPQSSTGVQLGIAYVSAPTALWNIVNSITDSEGEFPLQT